ncbi:MAG: rhomboid family intramembrane serine protease [Leptonema sp. (in: Bacteria)]|nr:rhomboid family intramembrane serine protease [Leptonema sp. (in: bacteria)]
MQQGYQIQYPVTSDGILRLMVLFTLAFLFELLTVSLFDADISLLVLSAGQNFQPLSLITHFFVTGGLISATGLSIFQPLIHLLFELLILWSFGSELDRLWGSKSLYRFFFSAQIFGAVLTVVIGILFNQPFYAYGFGGGLSAMLVAYALLWPNRKALFFFMIPMRMKWVVLMLFVFLLLGSLQTLILNLAGATYAFMFLWLVAKQGQSSSSSSDFYSSRSSSQPSRLQTVNPETSFFSKLKAKREEAKRQKRLEEKRRQIEERIEMKEEVDRLLEKISTHGVDSLSRKEKTFLDKASKEL